MRSDGHLWFGSSKRSGGGGTKAPVPGKLRFTYNGNYGLEWPDLVCMI
ncbi:MAG: hypothetical protein ACLU6Z_03135 [Odoribacter splanchnicus]